MALERGSLHPVVAMLDLDRTADEIEAAVADLAALSLLRPRQGAELGNCGGPADGPVEYLPSNPEVALTHLVGPIEADIRRLRRRADELGAHVMAMKPVFEEAWQGHFMKAPVEYLTSLDAIRVALERISASMRVELLAAHPHVPPPEALDDAYRRTAEPVARGVLCRTLYPHAALSHGYMRQHLSRMTELGVEFRTVSHIPDRLLLIDAATAIISDPEQPPGQGALVVRDPSLVRHLYRSWESVWDSGRPFVAADTAAAQTSPKEELRRSILHLLDAGMKDEMAARRLSMSTTTYRRHVADLLTELDAQSRFQAGSYARRAGWLTD
ncbi:MULTISPECIES: hypothetical protein [unclassified Streptomyces]|uniref:hypothetical protein n=1 Tax=unclassified Streptomyces TaxID=2593676 RepID=UPI00225B2783|nr:MULTISPECIES: hypothetical protein [unclassified Streptomyces]MCX4527054.1 hypothetical protein [Streptomyces sp. NBC_01551]MCX4542386.1 hypothetical protein [Streptomyces sp. NBC_01565]